MTSWQAFVLDNVQTAVFAPDHTAFSTGKAVASILTRFADRFAGEMRALPLPEGIVPPEVPRVTLQSDDRNLAGRAPRFQLNMGPARVDFVWTNSSLTEGPPLSDTVASCVEVLEHYVQANNVGVGRVALIVRRFCRCDNGAQELISRYCSEASQREPFNRSASFEIHNHKVYAPPEFVYRVNSWVRCRSATITADNHPAISVEQDFNTLAEDMTTRKFDTTDMRLFFETAGRETDDILRKYFPG